MTTKSNSYPDPSWTLPRAGKSLAPPQEGLQDNEPPRDGTQPGPESTENDTPADRYRRRLTNAILRSFERGERK
jgi:hypothetical protein